MEKKLQIIASILALMSAPSSFAFINHNQEIVVLEEIQKQANAGLLGDLPPTSFDEIHCSRHAANCFMKMRIRSMDDGYDKIQPMFCVIDPVYSGFDLYDPKDKKSPNKPLPQIFVNQIKACFGIQE